MTMGTSAQDLTAAQQRQVTKLTGQIDQENERIRYALAEKMRLSNWIDDRTHEFNRKMAESRRDSWTYSVREISNMRRDQDRDQCHARKAIAGLDQVMDRAGQQLHRLHTQHQALTGHRYES